MNNPDYLPERTIVTGVRDVQVEQPRVHDRRLEGQKKVINRGVNQLNFVGGNITGH